MTDLRGMHKNKQKIMQKTVLADFCSVMNGQI